ncbi:MAG TPA: hypothetical protein VGL65_00755 [Gemmatimonadales bacterium]|jgi:hypothetical protein
MPTNHRTIVRVALVALLVAAARVGIAPAQGAHPDLSGTWALDTAKSQGGPLLPQSATYTIAQHGDTITMDRVTTTTMGDATVHAVIGTDGKEWKNSASAAGQTVELTSTASWAHDTLEQHQSGSLAGNEFSEDDRIFMSSDAKIMTMIRTIHVGGQDYPPLTMVFSKKP